MAVYYGTRLSQAFIRRGHGSRFNEGRDSIVYYPAFSTEEAIADQISRILWYLPPNVSPRIWLGISAPLENVRILELASPSYTRKSNSSGQNLHISICQEDELAERAVKAGLICVWNAERNASFLRSLFPAWSRMRIVDPLYYMFAETHSYPAILWYDILTAQQRSASLQRSRDIFTKLWQDFHGSRQVYVFGTGPSLQQAKRMDFKDGISIICNSMVRNDDLLARIQPDILVFTDSVFHFGVSRYAEMFAKDVLKVVREYQPYIITNQVACDLLCAHYPELRDHIIGVPAKRFGSPRPLTVSSFMSRDYPNVLTRFMLPLAAGLSNDVVLTGFDGRAPREGYFWKHSSASQYSELLETAKLSHPAFFRDIDYDGYYEKHCSTLERVISTFEEAGTRFSVRTNSYIPALKARSGQTHH